MLMEKRLSEQGASFEQSRRCRMLLEEQSHWYTTHPAQCRSLIIDSADRKMEPSGSRVATLYLAASTVLPWKEHQNMDN